ncbi:MAG: DUF2085 domain-containing protein [Coriobacteriia bacterium]|nr:DUF2085 domain-containing protein [Coriobacteriia bacterium]
MQEFLDFLGHGFCHQIASRCFEAGGLTFSVCARDTGIYLGFLFTLISAFIIYARTEKKPGDLPPLWCMLILILLVLPMALDGLSSYLGLRPTTNAIRYFTGLGTGIGAGILLTPLLFTIRKDADASKKAFDKPSIFALELLLTLVLSIAFFLLYPYLGVVSPFFAAAAFLALVVSLNLILLTLSKRLFPRRTLKHWLFLLALCLVLSFIEIAAFAAIRDLAVHILLGGQDFSSFMK